MALSLAPDNLQPRLLRKLQPSRQGSQVPSMGLCAGVLRLQICCHPRGRLPSTCCVYCLLHMYQPWLLGI